MSIVTEMKGRGMGGQGRGRGQKGSAGADICVCPSCGEEVSHQRGTPCMNTKCPKCGTPMVGKGAPRSPIK